MRGIEKSNVHTELRIEEQVALLRRGAAEIISESEVRFDR